VISHDRWFLDRIATHILAYEDDGGVVFHEGNFSDYEEDRRAPRRRRGPAAPRALPQAQVTRRRRPHLPAHGRCASMRLRVPDRVVAMSEVTQGTPRPRAGPWIDLPVEVHQGGSVWHQRLIDISVAGACHGPAGPVGRAVQRTLHPARSTPASTAPGAARLPAARRGGRLGFAVQHVDTTKIEPALRAPGRSRWRTRR
jgi:hypothetical protein